MRPKLSGVATSPRPKSHCQTRLTITRAVSGFSAEAIAFASARRPPAALCAGRAAEHFEPAARHGLAGLRVIAARHQRVIAPEAIVAQTRRAVARGHGLFERVKLRGERCACDRPAESSRTARRRRSAP